MIQTLEIVMPLSPSTEDAAATAMLHTAARLHAHPSDINLVLAVLFDQVLS